MLTDDMRRRSGTSALVRAVIVVGLITAGAGALRLWNLGHPPEKVFDEVYYASDACLFAGEDHRACDLDSPTERSWVHPPLGKHLISWGVHGFGNRPVGWRAPSAIAGTATVAMVGALAFLLTRSAAWAGVASLFLAVEHLHVVQSRIAMLDVFQAFFAVLGFLLLVWWRVRRDRGEAEALHPAGGGTAHPEAGPHPGPQGGPWLWIGAGAAFGAGTAVKWSGVYALAAGAVLALVWERSRRRRLGSERPLARTIVEHGPFLILAFGLVPLLAYAATWIPWLADHGFGLAGWWRNHIAMADYHVGLQAFENGEPIHPYMSEAWTWLALLRPVAYYFQGAEDTAAEILAIGHPLLFWGAFLILPYLAVSWWRLRDWRAGAILVPILLQYVPWLFVQRPLFLFYMTPVTPFLALGAAYVLRDLTLARILHRRVALAVAAAVVVTALALFAFFWPVLVGETISREAWEARIWFDRWI
jgi:dolichyl-phosphate-mannose-protein mannosyltransferase